MKNQQNFLPSLVLLKKRGLILLQFFLIIIVYHTLKDLKDTIVITASDAGAEIIPFIKIWGMLPLAVCASYFFAKFYSRFGREKTFYIFGSFLLINYLIFAFILYPFRDLFYLESVSNYLQIILPVGAKGFVAMISYWHYTLFYLTAELWSMLILSILFWSYVNDTTSLEEAKYFYPLCMFIGNVAGIVSGQFSHYLCHHLSDLISWQSTLQWMISLVCVCGLLIMFINQRLTLTTTPSSMQRKENKHRSSASLKDNIIAILRSGPLFCIAVLVVGFGLTTNLIEVVWKESIRQVHPTPQAYNAYINQLTSLIGILAVCVALLSRWIFQKFTWTQIALVTPVCLLVTSFAFFSSLIIPKDLLGEWANFLQTTPTYLTVTLGSIYYVFGMSAKYTIFDTSKEMAFLSIDSEERTRAKSVIDSIGSRLGKSGASCFYQFLLIAFGVASEYILLIGIISIGMIGVSVFTTRKLGGYLSGRSENAELVGISNS
jgi:AAA family ATP:ADP antiporter